MRSMWSMRKLSVPLVVLSLLLATSAVFAAVTYEAPLVVTETNGTAYTMLPVFDALDNQWLADNGFMAATALDTRVESLGGLEYPWMVVDDRTLTALPVPADSQTNLLYTTGNSAAASMDIIVGQGGYITTAYAAALELGNNFEIETDGYVNTDAGASKNIVNKQYSFRTYIDGATNITSEISTVNDSDQLSLNTFSDISNGLAIQRSGQSVTAFPTATILSVQVYLLKVLAPVGNAYCRVWDTATPPNVLGTLGQIDVTTIVPGYYTFNTTPVTVSAGTVVIGMEYNGGDAANYVRVGADNTNPKAGENLVTATLAGNWATTAGTDINYQNLTYLTFTEVTANGVANGEHIVKTTADGVDLKIFIDGSPEGSTALAGATAYDYAASNWIIDQTNVLPYMDYYKHTVGGTLIAHYQPVTMIIGTALPDREGAAQNGVITWGANPAGVAAAIGGMVAATQPVPGTYDPEAPRDTLREVAVSDWFTDPAIGGSLLTNPLRPFVTLISDNTTLNEIQSWRLLALAILLLVTVGTAKLVSGHHLITGIMMCAGIIFAIALTIFPLWSLVFAGGAFIGGLIAERSPSV